MLVKFKRYPEVKDQPSEIAINADLVRSISPLKEKDINYCVIRFTESHHINVFGTFEEVYNDISKYS